MLSDAIVCYQDAYVLYRHSVDSVQNIFSNTSVALESLGLIIYETPIAMNDCYKVWTDVVDFN